MSKTGFCLLNTLTLILTLAVNYLASAGLLTGQSMGQISARYQTLITPAGYAFSIWGFIYLWLIAYVAYQWYARNRTHAGIIKEAGGWFALANLANAAWVWAFTSNEIALSVLLMFVLLYALIKLVQRHRLEIWDAPLRMIALVWWPICWYLGWIILASVTNVAAYLVSLDWSGGPLRASSWTLLMIAIATVIYLLLIKHRNLREASLVGVWGLVAIAIANWESEVFIAGFALIAAAILLIATGIHGARNQATAPHRKWQRGEI